MKIIFDKSGFPMVNIEPAGFWMHIWPVTKIQFENFLCQEPNSEMDEGWYEQVLNNNPRITPTRVTTKNYWQLFVTGIEPEKLQWFAEWNGNGFEIPTASDWNVAYRFLNDQDLFVELIDELRNTENNLDPLVEIVASKLQEVLSTFSQSNRLSMADQFLMRKGIMEWVKLTGESSEWGGLGDPHPSTGWATNAVVGQGRPEIVRSLKVRHYGCRLIKKV